MKHKKIKNYQQNSIVPQKKKAKVQFKLLDDSEKASSQSNNSLAPKSHFSKQHITTKQMQKIMNSFTQKSSHFSLPALEPTKYLSPKTPSPIIDTLYRQNIKNYNPYLSTLDVLENTKGLSVWQKQRIACLCHIGVAKQYLKTKKYSQTPQYSRVNVLIRTYMRQKMSQHLKQIQSQANSVVFIQTTPLALTFNPREFPQVLQGIIPSTSYANVIIQVNKIIESQYLRFKSSGNVKRQQPFCSTLLLGLLILLSVLFIFIENPWLLLAIFIAILMWMLCCIHSGRQALQQLAQPRASTNIILTRISNFFKQINTQRIQWKVGEDFYWLEVHYIKRKNHTN